MKKSFYAVSEQFRNAKIYVWNVNHSSYAVFTFLAFKGADIEGFVDPENRFIGEQIMNRRIVSIEQLRNMEDDVTVVVHREVDKLAVERCLGDIRVYYISDMFCFNKELCGKEVYIYGIGKRGEEIYDLLSQNNVTIKAACITKRDTVQYWNNLPVFSISEINKEEDNIFVIATTVEQSEKEILAELAGFRGDVYLEEVIREHEYWGELFYRLLIKR